MPVPLPQASGLRSQAYHESFRENRVRLYCDAGVRPLASGSGEPVRIRKILSSTASPRGFWCRFCCTLKGAGS